MRRLSVALLVVLVAGTGCGVPSDEEPRVLDRSTAPFRFFERDVAPPPQGELRADLFFLRGDVAVPVQRPLEAPGTPSQVLEQLLEGPTEAELAAGLSSAIPRTLQLVDVTVDERVAVLALEGLNEQVQVPAYAQIVATLDGRPGIDGVRFRSGDADLQVPQGEGGLSSGAVTREDYRVLLGLVPPSPAAAQVVPPQPGPATPAG